MNRFPTGVEVSAVIKDIASTIVTLTELKSDMEAVLNTGEPEVSGTLPDGTPIAEMLEELKETRKRVADMHQGVRQILNLCDQPLNAQLRRDIRDLAAKIAKM